MHETQSTIAAWADAAFGEVRTPRSSVARALKEMVELVACVVDGDGDAVSEAADVVICLTRLGRWAGVDVIAAAREELMPSGGPVENVSAAAAALVQLLVIDLASPLFSRRLLHIVGLLNEFATSRGASLGVAIDEKMAINRRRQWRRDGHGHGYHLSAGESIALGSWDAILARTDQARASELDQAHAGGHP